MTVQKDLVVGIDSSTTSCKAIAWDRTGNPIAESRTQFEMLSPKPNWFEQNAMDWLATLHRVLRDLVVQIDARRVAALCITNQRESFVLVNEQGLPLRNAILWLDDRSRTQVRWLGEQFGNEMIHDLTGKGPSTTQSLPKIIWLQQNEPEMIDSAYKLVEPHAFLVYHLTGKWATSTACADPMGIVDMRRGDWAVDFLNTLKLPLDKFVEIVPPGTVIGQLSQSGSEQTGLPPETLVVAGSGDGQSAGLGANITQPGRAYLNLGTAMVSGAFAESYVADPAFRTLCSPVAGAFVPEEVLPGGTFLVSWFVENFGPDVSNLNLSLSAVEVLEAAAAKVPPGSLGLMLVPYWKGAMPPYWDADATGVMIGWTGAHRKEHFYRAVLEGIAFEHRLVMDGVSRATGQPIDEYILMGGGSRSPLWCQIIADMTGKRVTRSHTAEATNLGAGILAAAAVGWYDDVRDAARSMTSTERSFFPSDETHAIYDQLYREVYTGLYPAVQPFVDHLALLTYGQ